MTPDVRTFIWTWFPVILTVFAFGVTERRLAPSLLFVNLVAGQALYDRLGDQAFTPWAAVGFGCIDYATAVLAYAGGEHLIAGVFVASVISHAGFAIRLHGLSDPYLVYGTELAYGWASFTIAVLAALTIIGGGYGGGRRFRLGGFVPSRGGNRARLQDILARTWRMRG